MKVSESLREKKCFTCGRKLDVSDTMIPGMPRLYEGVICTVCKKVQCVSCKGRPLDASCHYCGGKVAPAYEQTLESAVYEARDLDAKEEAEAAKNAELARAVDFQTSLDEIGKLLGELSELKRLDAIDKIRLMPLSAENRKRLLYLCESEGRWYQKMEDVEDVDGNRYGTIKIGNQIWMTENLRVTKYNDGTPIEHEKGETEEYESRFLFFVRTKKTRKVDWKLFGKKKLGAFCYNESNYENNKKYGALYNWYAVNSNKLAPVGWHVPSDQEWQELCNFCGGKGTAGWFLKAGGSTWDGYNNGFGALPAGSRDNVGNFNQCGMRAYFWSSTNWGVDALYRYIFSGCDELVQGRYGKEYGFSVRCIKDAP